jgi:hypothetical protein
MIKGVKIVLHHLEYEKFLLKKVSHRFFLHRYGVWKCVRLLDVRSREVDSVNSSLIKSLVDRECQEKFHSSWLEKAEM